MNEISLDEISIRNELRPGDIGYVTYLHGILCYKEYGFTLQFDYFSVGTRYPAPAFGAGVSCPYGNSRFPCSSNEKNGLYATSQ